MGKIPALISLVAFLCLSPSATGATWYVHGSVPASGDGSSWQTAFKTIQEGIDAASDGDTVLVASGTYFENIHFNGKNITLTSTDPLHPDTVASTIINGNQAGPVVTFEGTENDQCAISGFTVSNGEGVGIFGGSSRATLRNNVVSANARGGLSRCHGTITRNTVSENNTTSFGGGLYHCNGVIANNIVRHNTSRLSGGGLAFCQAKIEGNLILDNRSDDDGGGLYCCDQVIRGNVISDNSARDNGGGLAQCDGTVHGNVILSNGASRAGGGLYECDGLITSNRISLNRAWGDCTPHKGALASCDGIIASNLIYGNWAEQSTAGLDDCNGLILNNTIVQNSGWALSECFARIANCIIWGNLPPYGDQIQNSNQPAFSCIQDWQGGGDGNINLDPSFANPHGPDGDTWSFEDNDYRLSATSPCIDTGDNTALDGPGFDLDGNLRIAFGRTSLTVDMGAYEFNSSPFAVTHMFRLENDRLLLTWASQPGDVYLLLSTSDLSAIEWTLERESLIPSQGATTSCIVTLPLGRLRFYRVETGP